MMISLRLFNKKNLISEEARPNHIVVMASGGLVVPWAALSSICRPHDLFHFDV